MQSIFWNSSVEGTNNRLLNGKSTGFFGLYLAGGIIGRRAGPVYYNFSFLAKYKQKFDNVLLRRALACQANACEADACQVNCGIKRQGCSSGTVCTV